MGNPIVIEGHRFARSERDYKVLRANGESQYAYFDYSEYLPRNGKPGPWLPLLQPPLRMCRDGYHTTKHPKVWGHQGMRVYLVEIVGFTKYPTNGREDKRMCRSFRFLKRISIKSLGGWDR